MRDITTDSQRHQRVGLLMRAGAVCLDTLIGTVIFIVAMSIYVWVTGIDLMLLIDSAKSSQAHDQYSQSLATLYFPLLGLLFLWCFIEVPFAASPGKMILGLRIRRIDGTSSSLGQLFSRSSLKHLHIVGPALLTVVGLAERFDTFISLACFVLVVGNLAVLTSSRQTLLDLIVNTAVYPVQKTSVGGRFGPLPNQLRFGVCVFILVLIILSVPFFSFGNIDKGLSHDVASAHVEDDWKPPTPISYDRPTPWPSKVPERMGLRFQQILSNLDVESSQLKSTQSVESRSSLCSAAEITDINSLFLTSKKTTEKRTAQLREISNELTGFLEQIVIKAKQNTRLDSREAKVLHERLQSAQQWVEKERRNIRESVDDLKRGLERCTFPERARQRMQTIFGDFQQASDENDKTLGTQSELWKKLELKIKHLES